MLFDRRRLAPSPRAVARTVRLGSAPHHEALVIDDFYADPEYVRELALSLDYSRMRGTYPGYEARVSLDTSAILAEVRKRVDPSLTVMRDYDAFVFSMMHEGVDPKLRHYPHPHADTIGNGGVCLAGLVYLNPDDRCHGGTSFYRHRQTGAFEDRKEISPGIADYMVRHRLSTVSEAYEHMVLVTPEAEAAMEHAEAEWGYIRGSNEVWELTATLEMRFNRFVLFDSYFFHHPSIEDGQFGRTDQSRRLTQTIFFETPAEADQPAAEGS